MPCSLLPAARTAADGAWPAPHPELALASPVWPPWSLLEVLPRGQDQLCPREDMHTLSVPPSQGDAHELLTLLEPSPEVRHSSKQSIHEFAPKSSGNSPLYRGNTEAPGGKVVSPKSHT